MPENRYVEQHRDETARGVTETTLVLVTRPGGFGEVTVSSRTVGDYDGDMLSPASPIMRRWVDKILEGTGYKRCGHRVGNALDGFLYSVVKS